MSVGDFRLGRARVARPAEAVAARLTAAQQRLAAILCGGAVGATARAGLNEALPHATRAWPWSTFTVNLTGAFILGWLLTRLTERIAPTRNWRPLIGTGFCGALTTFSTFELELFELLRHDRAGLAVAYALTSIVAGMAVAVLGVMVARWGRHW